MPPLAAWETQAWGPRGIPGRLEAAAVAHPETDPMPEAGEEVHAERRDEQHLDEPCLRQFVHLLPLLEADVLECLCGRPVQLGRPFVVPPSSCQVAARDPRGRAMAT